MRTLTCKELGGACDAPIGGATPEEMGDACKAHVLRMIKQGEDDHIAALRRMEAMSPGDFAVFWADLRRKFAEAE